MKVKKDFIVRRVMDDVILVPVGSSDSKFNGLITTNELGAFIWKRITKGYDTDEIVKAILNEYDTNEQQARSDVEEFVATLRKNGIIE